MRPPDPALLAAACGGDRAAVDRLLAQVQPDLRRFARRTCANSDDAEDAVQAALWQLHRQVGALRVMQAFVGWIFRIVERECYRLFRAARAEPISDALEQSLSAAPLPQALRLDLVRAIAALPAPYREVLVLRDIDELSAPEAAAQLGLTQAAVKSRLHRARAMMRERLMAGSYWGAHGNDG